MVESSGSSSGEAAYTCLFTYSDLRDGEGHISALQKVAAFLGNHGFIARESLIAPTRAEVPLAGFDCAVHYPDYVGMGRVWASGLPSLTLMEYNCNPCLEDEEEQWRREGPVWVAKATRRVRIAVTGLPTATQPHCLGVITTLLTPASVQALPVPAILGSVSGANICVGHARSVESLQRFVRIAVEYFRTSSQDLIVVLTKRIQISSGSIAHFRNRGITRLEYDGKSAGSAEGGKTLRIVSATFQRREMVKLWSLSALSLCTGTQSWSEVVHYGGAFLYEPLIHKRALAAAIADAYGSAVLLDHLDLDALRQIPFRQIHADILQRYNGMQSVIDILEDMMGDPGPEIRDFSAASEVSDIEWAVDHPVLINWRLFHEIRRRRPDGSFDYPALSAKLPGSSIDVLECDPYGPHIVTPRKS